MTDLTSGYELESGICWYFGNKGDTRLRCKCPVHAARGYGARTLAFFGRCRSGQRWFWSARTLSFDATPRKTAEGFADSEADAMDAAMDAVRGFRDGRPILATASHGCASGRLAARNKAKRLTRPPSDAKDSRVVEYLYGRELIQSDYGGDPSYHVYYRFRILKRTKCRIFYLRKEERIDEHGTPLVYANMHSWDDDTGFVDRQKFETERRITSSHIWAADWHLYASLEEAVAHGHRHDKPAEQPDLAALKQAMVEAHPDKGGTSAAFVEARKRYVAARRHQRREGATP